MTVLNSVQQMMVENAQLQAKLGPEIRALRGLPPNKVGSSTTLNLGDVNKTLVDVRPASGQAATPEMMTVNLGLTLVSGDVGLGGVDISANVEWGVGGANFQATLDVIRGTTFSLVANYLRVSLSYAGSAPAPPATAPVFQANAAVGYGSGPLQRTGSVRRTFDLGTIAHGGGFATIPIPNFATSFGVVTFGDLLGPPTPNLWLISSTTGLGSTPASYVYNSVSNLSNQIDTTYELQGNADTLFVVNQDPAKDILVSVIFALSL